MVSIDMILVDVGLRVHGQFGGRVCVISGLPWIASSRWGRLWPVLVMYRAILDGQVTLIKYRVFFLCLVALELTVAYNGHHIVYVCIIIIFIS